MDNVTHSLFGAVLARAGFAQRHGRGTTALLVVASNIPDLDAILLLTHGESAAWLRRTHTHCVTGGPVLALLLGLAWWLGSRKRIPLRVTCGLSLLGVAGHVGLDLLNSYGVVALWPFTIRRFELAWVYIIDLAMLAILLSPLLLRRWLRSREARLHQVVLVLFLAYVAACAAGRARAGALLRAELAREGITPSFTWVFPEALGPHRWRAVARDGDRWRTWLVHVLDGRMELGREDVTQEGDAAVARVRQTRRARDVERFFKAPVWTLDESRTRATCVDLRFVSLVIERGSPFEYEFEVPPAETAP